METMVPQEMAAERDLEEEKFVLLAAGGDRSAFGELYQRYARVVHAILLARVPPADADDLVQDVFISAMRNLPALRAPAAFRGWLASIARNRAADYHRHHRATASLEETEPAGAAVDGHHMQAEAIVAIISKLPETYRETLLMRLVEGMTGPEIALRTGLTHSSVRVNLCRGMKILRERLGGREAP
jgi:RNA polymerase sigma-70 factor (ECF subfamily)